MRRIATLCVLLLAVSGFRAFSLDFFAEGERLYLANKPAEAIPMLYQASLAPGVDPRVFIHLGICYQQVGKYADAIGAYMRGSSVVGADRKVLFSNAGLVYSVQNLYSEAETMYSKAIEIDSAFAPAWLNRANARVGQKKFAGAVDDYTMYLTLDPASPQRDPITKLIALLNQEQASAQEAAQRAEAAKAVAEAEKAAAAAEKAAADERYKKLMDEVSSSLQSVDGASTLSAGSESVMEYDEEGQLE